MWVRNDSLWAGRPGFVWWKGQSFFFPPLASDTQWVQLVSYVMDAGISFPGSELPEPVAASNSEVSIRHGSSYVISLCSVSVQGQINLSVSSLCYTCQGLGPLACSIRNWLLNLWTILYFGWRIRQSQDTHLQRTAQHVKNGS